MTGKGPTELDWVHRKVRKSNSSQQDEGVARYTKSIYALLSRSVVGIIVVFFVTLLETCYSPGIGHFGVALGTGASFKFKLIDKLSPPYKSHVEIGYLTLKK